MSYLSMNGVVRSQSYTYFNFKSVSGVIKEIPTYCINPTTKGVPQSVSPDTSIKYIANEVSNDPKIVGIIANGYPHRGLSELKRTTPRRWRSGAISSTAGALTG